MWLMVQPCGLWSHAAVMSVVLCLSAVNEVQPYGSWSSHVAHGPAMWLMVQPCGSWSHAAVMSVVLCLSAVHEVQPCGSWSSCVAPSHML